MSTDEWRPMTARQSPRLPFDHLQQIAEIVDGVVPSPADFENVRCVDISRSGFAFYRRSLPESNEIVVALGEAPDLVYLTARIVQYSIVERSKHTLFRVGCHFTGRVELNEHSLTLKQQQDIEAAFFLMSDRSAG